MQIISDSPEKTAAIAHDLARRLSKTTHDQATVVGLEGELGAGKTTFAQAFARSVGVEEYITSPTFVIMKSYELKKGFSEKNAWKYMVHIDAYRLVDGGGLAQLGVGELFAKSDRVILIEWAERVRDILPEDHITVHIDHVEDSVRKINIHGE